MTPTAASLNGCLHDVSTQINSPRSHSIHRSWPKHERSRAPRPGSHPMIPRAPRPWRITHRRGCIMRFRAKTSSNTISHSRGTSGDATKLKSNFAPELLAPHSRGAFFFCACFSLLLFRVSLSSAYLQKTCRISMTCMYNNVL